MYHHTKDSSHLFGYTGDFSHFVEKLFLQGRVEFGCFWKWHAGWEKAAAANPAILWISFEDLKRDPVQGVRTIAAFLDVPCSDDVIRQVVGESTFEAMKSKFAVVDKERESLGKMIKKNHIRRGAVGSWQ